MRIDPASVAAPGLKSWLLYAISRFLCYAWQELNSLHLYCEVLSLGTKPMIMIMSAKMASGTSRVVEASLAGSASLISTGNCFLTCASVRR